MIGTGVEVLLRGRKFFM
ncbi:hypothetical protein AAHA92_17831 [Salvia divinorum]|uniref:Uncharacterized protein n=1 Tax=Salvia divinorum TaxID=28513 RepID=A0ABD1H028_SALDI